MQVLQLAAHLRRAGFFVLAALTLPFDFEGRRKVEEAAALVEALQDVANLVVSRAVLGWLVGWLGHNRTCTNPTLCPNTKTKNDALHSVVLCCVLCYAPAGGCPPGCAGACLHPADSHTGTRNCRHDPGDKLQGHPVGIECARGAAGLSRCDWGV